MKLIYTLFINFLFTSILIFLFKNYYFIQIRNKDNSKDTSLNRVNGDENIKNTCLLSSSSLKKTKNKSIIDIKELNIFVSTLKRNETKYKYLKKQFKSFEIYFKEFKEIKLNFNVFERENNKRKEEKEDKDLKELKKSKNFSYSTFKQIKNEIKIEIKSEREKNILNQTLDFLSLFKKIKNEYCKGLNSKKIFLYLEDGKKDIDII